MAIDVSALRWQDEAQCRGEDLTLFFGADHERGPTRESREREAKQVCMGCPSRVRCLDWAIDRREIGVWGGLTDDERAAERRRRQRRANAA